MLARPVLRYPIQPGQAMEDAIVWAVEMYRGQYGEPRQVWLSAQSVEGKAIRESGADYVCDGYQAAVKSGVPADQVWVI